MQATLEASSSLGRVFGARLKRYRKALHLKQEAVGQAVGCSKSTISEIENGKYAPHLDKAVALARFFGVSVDALVNEGEEDGHSEWLAGVREKAFAWPDECKLTIAELLKALAHELEMACEN